MTHPLTIVARNIATGSANKVHDTAVARQLGFAGGLVPGAELFGYLGRVPLGRYGLDWLRRGELFARFVKPVYQGSSVVVTEHERDGGLELAALVDGVRCVEGAARIPGQEWAGPADLTVPQPPGSLPPADENSLAVGVRLGIVPREVSVADTEDYLLAVGESDSLYGQEAIVPPGLLLRLCNRVVDENVTLGPWIHTASTLRNLSLARAGSRFTAIGTVTGNDVRNGHHYVELSVLLIADGLPVADVAHEAIYRLRPSAGQADAGPALR